MQNHGLDHNSHLAPPLLEEDNRLVPASSHVSPCGWSLFQSVDKGDENADINVTSLLRSSRKWPADMGQFVDMITREKRFKTKDKSILLRFATVSHSLWMLAYSHIIYTFSEITSITSCHTYRGLPIPRKTWLEGHCWRMARRVFHSSHW